MTALHVISQLLESEEQNPKNTVLLKKIIVTTYLGRLQVNGQPPDNNVSMCDYLFDDERIMFDFTRLSDEKKNQFNQWLLSPHEKEKEQTYVSGVSVNEYRGFTAEVALSWWGVFINWVKGEATQFWKLAQTALSLDYQITGIEICHGKSGSLIGFTQFQAPGGETKYKDATDPQKEPLRNTKRVFITDSLVDKLCDLPLESLDFNSILNNAHPYAIDVVDTDARFKEMHDYRKMQKYIELKPWYVRMWRWVVSWFEPVVIKPEPLKQELELLYETDTTRIYQRSITKEVIVVEKKPDIENLVSCGGGGKIFAHLGVIKALHEASIYPKNFAGSSAGAIISLLGYMGYTADELIEIFKEFKREHIVHFDIDTQGISSTQSLRTALDYAVAKKIMHIVTEYNVPYPQGKITFATLDALRRQCPGCGIGNELVMTASNKRSGKARYFSLKQSPDFESTMGSATSASLPWLYKPTVIDGDEYNDGGITSNFPTEVFSDDNSTLLESEYGNNLKTLAIQFDNGTERDTIDKMQQVYKENFIINGVYRVLTGVKDPASGWEQDRLKLRKHAGQSVVVEFEEEASTSLDVDESTREKLIESGYKATQNYLKVRYSNKEGKPNKNKELMYSTFSSLGDLLAYCCYRDNKFWFDIVKDLIANSSLPNKMGLLEQAWLLQTLHFNVDSDPVKSEKEAHLGFFNTHSPQQNSENRIEYPELLLAIYPIFIKVTSVFVVTKADKKALEQGLHSLRIDKPFACLEYFATIKGDTHILLHTLINALKELKANPNQQSFALLKQIEDLLSSDANLLNPKFFGQWNISSAQSVRVLKLFKSNDTTSLVQLCDFLRQGIEPMQTIVNTVYYDELDNDGYEGAIKSMQC